MARHWAAGDGDLQAAAKCQLKMASTFMRLVIWRSVFIFFGTRSLVKGQGKGSGRVSGKVRLGLEYGRVRFRG